MELTLVDVIGHLAFLLTAISLYLKDILLLRFLAIVSSIVGIGYNYFLDEGRCGCRSFGLAFSRPSMCGASSVS